MDFTPPTRHPCICDELANGKRSGMLIGRFQPKPPHSNFRNFVWNACPRHGGFVVGEIGQEMRKQLGHRFYETHFQNFDYVRTWMFEEGAYRYGTEPPWEPTYLVDGETWVYPFPFPPLTTLGSAGVNEPHQSRPLSHDAVL